ncbi:MAG: hypothetical protein JST92_08535 [Deltaproteobacteria bacterium]|nr:hypothetical protein [Deltaproteobacteria bacterium]
MSDAELRPILAALLKARVARPPYETLVREFAARHEASPDGVKFWLSAIGSYETREAFKGPKRSYDREHLQVFRVLDAIAGKPHGWLRRARDWLPF